VPSELLALVSASCFAGAFVAAKKGLKDTSVVAALLVTLGCAWVVILAATVVVDPPDSASRDGVGVFVVTGIVAPGIGYWAALAGVNSLGPSIAVPMQQGGRALVSMSGAVLLLRESINLSTGLGIVAILAGSIGLSRRRAPVGEAPPGGRDFNPTNRLLASKNGLMFPVIAGLAFAAFDVLVKHGLTRMNDPTFASMITIGSGFVAWLLLVASLPALRRTISFGRSIGWIIVGGLMFAFASMSVFHALLLGRLVLVGPILGTQPLIVFVLSKLVLRDVELIHPLTLVFGMMVVAGTFLVVL
jgi:drug/metabolite transporter (DMT)-like permease